MTLTSDTVLSSLRALEAQLSSYRDRVAELNAARDTGDRALVWEGLRGVQRVVEGLVVHYARLRKHVIAFDAAAMGTTVGSFGELGLRAQTLLVTQQLNQIAHALDAEPRPTPPGGGRAERLFTGRFGSLDEVTAFICERITRINAIWMAPRAGGVRVFGPDESTASHVERVACYRWAIRGAQRALVGLGDDPDIAAFLRAGAACLDWPVVHAACTNITLALQIALDPGPDMFLSERSGPMFIPARVGGEDS